MTQDIRQLTTEKSTVRFQHWGLYALEYGAAVEHAGSTLPLSPL